MYRDIEADGLRSVCRTIGLHKLDRRDGSLINTVCQCTVSLDGQCEQYAVLGLEGGAA